MKIIDTFQDMVDTFSNGPFNMDKWEKYADHISPSLTKKVKADCRDYHFETQILPIITHMLQNIEKAEQAHRSFVKAVEELPQKTADIFGEELEISIIFYLGLCNGAGWATDLNGQSVILMGIEKIVELNWCNERNMAALLYHELGHIWHYAHRTVPTTVETQKQKALWQLYTEGMAMYCEQLLYDDPNFYHQDQGQWLPWCQNNQSRLFQVYAQKMSAGESVQPFYGDWCQWEGHSDVGYFLGALLIRSLAEKYTLKELTNLSLETIEEKVLSMA